MFLEPTDFLDKPYKVPNQEESRDFVAFIEATEAKYLKAILGLQLYNDFIEGLEDSGTVEQKWTDLKDGANYTYSDVLYEWRGVKAMLKPVVYSEWLTINFRRWTSSGMIINTGQQNSGAVNPDQEIIRGWNEFVDLLGCRSGMYWYSPLNYHNNLYGFLYTNSADYNDWDFSLTTYFQYINIIDL